MTVTTTATSTVDGLDDDQDDDFNDGPLAALLALRHGTAPTADRAPMDGQAGQSRQSGGKNAPLWATSPWQSEARRGLWSLIVCGYV